MVERALETGKSASRAFSAAGSFDLVLSLNGFHAFPDKEAAYAEVKTVEGMAAFRCRKGIQGGIKYPQECKETRQDIDRSVRKVIERRSGSQ